VAKNKLPASLKPKKTIGDALTEEFKHFYEKGGGNPKGKGQPVLRGDDPRNQVDPNAEASLEPEFVGFDRDTGEAIFKPAPQKGNPELHPVKLGPNAGGTPDTSGTLGPTDVFSDDQIALLLEDYFGKKGGGLNATPDKRPTRRIFSTPIPEKSGNIFSTPIPTSRDHLLSMPVPTSKPRIFSTPVPTSKSRILSTPVSSSHSGLMNSLALPGEGKLDLKALLALLARNQATANGYNRIGR